MKKFITLFIIAIVAMTACTSQVAKDLRQVVGDDIKVVSVKSVDVKTDFYTYTNEYIVVKKTFENYDKQFWSADSKKELEEAYAGVCEYRDKVNFFKENGRQEGQVYVAKLKSKNEFTGKYNNFNGYRIFAYDSDGSIHEVDSGKDMQMICAVFPEAKKDIKKALEVGLQMFADALSDL